MNNSWITKVTRDVCIILSLEVFSCCLLFRYYIPPKPTKLPCLDPRRLCYVIIELKTQHLRLFVFICIGRKSYIRTPAKLATSVAYPFAFIKPSGTHGAVTLKEINQRIRTPPPPKQKEPEIYPTSAFSGKPVVGKTKIRTEGGKGSITIMRTKG